MPLSGASLRAAHGLDGEVKPVSPLQRFTRVVRGGHTLFNYRLSQNSIFLLGPFLWCSWHLWERVCR
jgi:hypothetical protein